MTRTGVLRVPDPMDCDTAADRYHHVDVPDLATVDLVREVRRADLAAAVLSPASAGAAWWAERRAASVAELGRRGLTLQ